MIQSVHVYRHSRLFLCSSRSEHGRGARQAGALVHVYTDGTVLLTHGGVEMGQARARHAPAPGLLCGSCQGAMRIAQAGEAGPGAPGGCVGPLCRRR